MPSRERIVGMRVYELSRGDAEAEEEYGGDMRQHVMAEFTFTNTLLELSWSCSSVRVAPLLRKRGR